MTEYSAVRGEVEFLTRRRREAEKYQRQGYTIYWRDPCPSRCGCGGACARNQWNRIDLLWRPTA